MADTLSRLQGKRISLIRADSGFYSKEIFEYLERKPVKYIIVARYYSAIQRKIAAIENWWVLGKGVEIAETTYQSPTWDKPRRLVVVRQQIQRRPKAMGKQLKLFKEEGIYRNYRYSCMITNLTLSAQMVWNMYKGRANCENRIKELKEDFGFASFNSQDFASSEAALNFVIIAYNIMSLFKQAVLKSGTMPQLKTMRYKIFAIGGYIIRRLYNKVGKSAHTQFGFKHEKKKVD